MSTRHDATREGYLLARGFQAGPVSSGTGCTGPAQRQGDPTMSSVADVWIDDKGNVHEREPDQPGLSLCGLNAGISNSVISARACPNCVSEHFAREQSPVLVP
ncbi:hypothetical protein [Saccharopolyspora tripterygii]